MINIISYILPIATLLIGFFLAEWAKLRADKREEKKLSRRQINTILFFLLELRYVFTQELRLEQAFDHTVKTVAVQFENDFGIELTGNEEAMNQVRKIVASSFPSNDEQLAFLEQNLDKAILQLAEWQPVFAYQLNGQYKIRERLQVIAKYWDQVEEEITKLPDSVKDLVHPHVTVSFLSHLTEKIIELSIWSGKKMAKEVERALTNQDQVLQNEGDTHLIATVINELLTKAGGAAHFDQTD